MDILQKARDYLFSRQIAYRQVFKPSLATETVLADLAKFCRAHETTFQPDARLHAQLEGRREVWLRIASHLNLSPEELWKLHERKNER